MLPTPCRATGLLRSRRSIHKNGKASACPHSDGHAWIAPGRAADQWSASKYRANWDEPDTYDYDEESPPPATQEPHWYKQDAWQCSAPRSGIPWGSQPWSSWAGASNPDDTGAAGDPAEEQAPHEDGPTATSVAWSSYTPGQASAPPAHDRPAADARQVPQMLNASSRCITGRSRSLGPTAGGVPVWNQSIPAARTQTRPPAPPPHSSSSLPADQRPARS